MEEVRERVGPSRLLRPTQKDVAAAAGVSQATVSLVLNKSGASSVPPATRTRVLKLASELGYRPHYPARMLRNACTMTLACVVPDLTNPFYPGLIRGFQRAARPAGYDVLIYETDGTKSGELRAVEWLLDGRADGAVGTFFHLRASDALAQFADRRLPLARLESRRTPGGALPIDSVYIDNFAAAAEMTRRLIARGHRDIVMIAGAHSPGERRAFGYASVMREHGLTPRLAAAAGYTEEAGADVMHRLLARRRRPSAVFGSSDVLALGALMASRDAGLRVPHDIAIAGFDDIPAAKLLGLTTVRQPENELGALAAKCLLERLDQHSEIVAGRSLGLPFEIIERTSA